MVHHGSDIGKRPFFRLQLIEEGQFLLADFV